MTVVRHSIPTPGHPETAPIGVTIAVCPDPRAERVRIGRLLEACGGSDAPAAGPVPRLEGLLGEVATRPGRRVDVWLALAETGGECVGLVALITTASAASVGWLLVSPAWRRRGVGRALVAVAAAAARDRGLGPVTAETRRDWSGAMAFWRSVADDDSGNSPA